MCSTTGIQPCMITKKLGKKGTVCTKKMKFAWHSTEINRKKPHKILIYFKTVLTKHIHAF